MQQIQQPTNLLLPLNEPSGNILGIDPGLSGAIAHFIRVGNEHVVLAHMWDMPTFKYKKTKRALDIVRLRDLLIGITPPGTVYLEFVAARPGQGVTSMFNFGSQYGALQALVLSQFWDLHLVTPQKWKKAMGLIKQPKEAALATAKECLGTTYFERKKDVGRADAALIALYGAST